MNTDDSNNINPADSDFDMGANISSAPFYFTDAKIEKNLLKIAGCVKPSSALNTWRSFSTVIARFDNYPSHIFKGDEWNSQIIITQGSDKFWYVSDTIYGDELKSLPKSIKFEWHKYMPVSVYCVICGQISTVL